MPEREEVSALVGAMDGGGTRSRYLIADQTGGVLLRVERGAAHLPGGAPVEEEAEALAGALASRFAETVRELKAPLPLGAVCVAVAGAGRAEERDALQSALVRRGVAGKVRVTSDVEAALHDAFGQGPGIVLLAGTGSVAVGRDERGGVHRVGGWGALLGDEGSGYAIGLQGLRAALRGEEGRGPATRLGASLLRAAGVDRLDELIGWSRGVRKEGIAAFAPVVLHAAEEGDEVAGEVVDQAVEALLAHITALSFAISTAPPATPSGLTVALGGGLLDPGAPLRARVAGVVGDRGLHIEARSVDGARGALGLALELLRG